MTPDHPTTPPGRPVADPVSLEQARARLGPNIVGPYDLHVTAGEIVALVGPNGAGKTTALHLLLGLRRLESGHAAIGGRAVTVTRPPVGAGVSLLDDGHRPWLTGADELADIASLRPAAPGARAALDLVGLRHAADQRTGAYSAGMLRRLGLARAFIGTPSVLILDEPTASLDHRAGSWLGRVLRELADDGTAILLATHDDALLTHTAARTVTVDGCRTR